MFSVNAAENGAKYISLYILIMKEGKYRQSNRVKHHSKMFKWFVNCTSTFVKCTTFSGPHV